MADLDAVEDYAARLQWRRRSAILACQWVRERARAFGWHWARNTFGKVADEATVLCVVVAFTAKRAALYCLLMEAIGQ